jgi:predicted nucleic acid-binding protein
MPGSAFLDSNILIYAVGQDESRRAIAEGLIVQGAVVSAQVLAETASVLGRKLHLPVPSVERILASITARVRCESVTAETVLAAVRLTARLGYSHYDSQIIVAALASKCEVLYSEDMQHGQLIDGTLTIVNPFAS